MFTSVRRPPCYDRFELPYSMAMECNTLPPVFPKNFELFKVYAYTCIRVFKVNAYIIA